MADKRLIEVENLGVTFKTRHGPVYAVRGVSLQLDAGETLAVLGESGSGKSVTAMSLMGLHDPNITTTSGSLRYDGVDLLGLNDSGWQELRGRRIAMIFQDAVASLNPVMSVGAQISEMVRVHEKAGKAEAKDRAVKMMERVQIPSAAERYDDYPHQFSGGMRQRIMIAMALVLNPELIIADEPTTALDVTVQAQIMRLLKELQAENGMAMMLITHDIGVSVQMADRIAVMYAGQTAESGPALEVYSNPKHPYTAGLLKSMPSSFLKGQRLNPIPGNPPQLSQILPGCQFRNRCPYAVDRCAGELPKLGQVGQNHFAACHRVEEIAHVGS